jgi:hypothetical protein
MRLERLHESPEYATPLDPDGRWMRCPCRALMGGATPVEGMGGRHAGWTLTHIPQGYGFGCLECGRIAEPLSPNRIIDQVAPLTEEITLPPEFRGHYTCVSTDGCYSYEVINAKFAWAKIDGAPTKILFCLFKIEDRSPMEGEDPTTCDIYYINGGFRVMEGIGSREWIDWTLIYLPPPHRWYENMDRALAEWDDEWHHLDPQMAALYNTPMLEIGFEDEVVSNIQEGAVRPITESVEAGSVFQSINSGFRDHRFWVLETGTGYGWRMGMAPQYACPVLFVFTRQNDAFGTTGNLYGVYAFEMEEGVGGRLVSNTSVLWHTKGLFGSSYEIQRAAFRKCLESTAENPHRLHGGWDVEQIR